MGKLEWILKMLYKHKWLYSYIFWWFFTVFVKSKNATDTVKKHQPFFLPHDSYFFSINLEALPIFFQKRIFLIQSLMLSMEIEDAKISILEGNFCKALEHYKRIFFCKPELIENLYLSVLNVLKDQSGILKHQFLVSLWECTFFDLNQMAAFQQSYPADIRLFNKLFLRANKLERKEDIEAIIHYERALKIKPELISVIRSYIISQLETRQKNWLLMNYLEIRPDLADSEFYSRFGEVAAEGENLDESIGHYLRALYLKPNQPEIIDKTESIIRKYLGL